MRFNASWNEIYRKQKLKKKGIVLSNNKGMKGNQAHAHRTVQKLPVVARINEIKRK